MCVCLETYSSVFSIIVIAHTKLIQLQGFAIFAVGEGRRAHTDKTVKCKNSNFAPKTSS